MNFEFKKPKIRWGETFKEGYYFNSKFLSRYKIEALQMLRNRVEDLPEAKRNETEEWKVIHQEYLKTMDKVKRTNQKKQPHYEKLRKRAFKSALFRMKQRLEWKTIRREEILKELDAGLDNIRNKITEMEEKINGRKE